MGDSEGGPHMVTALKCRSKRATVTTTACRGKAQQSHGEGLYVSFVHGIVSLQKWPWASSVIGCIYRYGCSIATCEKRQHISSHTEVLLHINHPFLPPGHRNIIELKDITFLICA
ncbi:hypothetical protein MRX96_011564 [Rhipicephalus microplus]